MSNLWPTYCFSVFGGTVCEREKSEFSVISISESSSTEAGVEAGVEMHALRKEDEDVEGPGMVQKDEVQNLMK